MTRDTGGPAFPNTPRVHAGYSDGGQQFGMTLRDWFAGQALTMMDDYPPLGAAAFAYQYADAMIAERSKP